MPEKPNPQAHEGIADLISTLACKDAVERDSARWALVRIGRAAVEPLLEALGATDSHVRWEAAKALFSIAEPVAAPALVVALDDKDQNVRWLAAEGLCAVGPDALQPLLVALVANADSDWLRDGAHHVLHKLVKKDPAHPAAGVLTALEQPEPQVAVPPAAEKALNALRDSA